MSHKEHGQTPHMSTMPINMTPALYAYFQSISLRESKILQELRHKTAQLPGGNMQISPEQGQFMGLLVELLGAKRILEVGTFTGYSALAMAQALPANGKVITCDINAQSGAIAQAFWERAHVASKIELQLGPAADSMLKLIAEGQAGTFDMVFIDADKNNYPIYYELALSLLRSGGLVLIDNVLWGGKVIDENTEDKQTQTLRALNQQLLLDERITLSMLPIGDGLTLARKP